ncbi:DUF4398 domain-containing protein [Geoalkalibacter sp.]|uniref:DUF4398 domain-containing protein n=1 Tax=Geoalkalibacter sp. TaxID=3041440 RepID=UPI00272EBDE6|nr:DUF4398 domain-containing protein [Geoalkalibacter sp.]
MPKLFLALLLLATTLAGCSAPPPRQELEGARSLVARAYAIGAEQLAGAPYRAAQEALRQGELDIAQGEYPRARSSFALAEHHAREAIRQTEQERLRREEERLAREAAERQALVPAAPTPAPAPSRSRPAAPSAAAPARPAAPAAAPAVALVPAPPRVSTYDVRHGDTLWLIAARPEVYGDPLLWPLLYKANRDQIKDPRQVFLGQTLDIPRNVSQEERDEVRAQALQSEIFPVDPALRKTLSSP